MFLRACGDAILGAGIHDGYLLVADRSSTPAPGLAVTAALDGELTVKYLRRIRGRRIALVPDHEAYPPLEATANESSMKWEMRKDFLHKLTAEPAGYY